jgi:hypothetical protein
MQVMSRKDSREGGRDRDQAQTRAQAPASASSSDWSVIAQGVFCKRCYAPLSLSEAGVALCSGCEQEVRTAETSAYAQVQVEDGLHQREEDGLEEAMRFLYGVRCQDCGWAMNLKSELPGR